jgi:hypothetical protein
MRVLGTEAPNTQRSLLTMMKYVKIDKSDNWNIGSIALHLIEIRDDGAVNRFIDLNESNEIIDFGPSEQDPYGATDHAPLSTDSDWYSNYISKHEFERLWQAATDKDV